jgi:hypothetical protein
MNDGNKGLVWGCEFEFIWSSFLAGTPGDLHHAVAWLA